MTASKLLCMWVVDVMTASNIWRHCVFRRAERGCGAAAALPAHGRQRSIREQHGHHEQVQPPFRPLEESSKATFEHVLAWSFRSTV